MPAAIVDKLNKEINADLVDPKIKTRLAELGGRSRSRVRRRFREAHRRGNRELEQDGQVRGIKSE
jgi:hypothetical protein